MLRTERRSPHFLPGVLLPESIDVARDIDPAVEIAVLAVPSHAMRAVAGTQRFSSQTILVNVAKGIENETTLCMHEVIEDVARPCIVVTLSGPSHAEEVANDLPASLVVADPARAGLGRDSADVVAATGAERVVLVSCDPVAMARDAALLAAHGYRHSGSTVLDLFPHTPHVEVVTRFDR